MSILAQLVIALAIFAAGLATGIKWHAGQDARAEQAARELRDSDERQQRQLADRAAGTHAARVATLSTQLGNAREQIARLSGRACLDPFTTGMLNAIGEQPGPAPAVEPAGAPATPAASASHGTGLRRYSSDRDIAGWIALCRTRYAEVSSQLNQILDIEAARHPEPKP